LTDANGGPAYDTIERGPRTPAQRAASVVGGLAERGVETVILAGSDTHGILRGKRVGLDGLARAADHGIALCEAIWALLVDEHEPVAPPDGHRGAFPGDGYPDVLAVPDLATTRIVPWQPATALVLCDFRDRDGTPSPLSPRDVLKAVIARARTVGYEPVAGLELECYVLRETPASVAAKRPGQLEPLDDIPRAYGVLAGSRQEEAFAGALRRCLADLGLPFEACHPEAGPGQFEITLRPAPALTAADQALVLRTAVKEVARREGLLATFMAKPRSDWPGSSCHLHLSLREDGRDAFHDPDADDRMAAPMRAFAAGLLASMPELTALMAPTPNSYRRYVAHSWAATTVTWALDNRSAGVRAVCDGPDATRLEHRQAGGDANPYLVTAAVLAAGLDGIERDLVPPAPARGDLYALPPGAHPGLPRTLAEATGLLEHSGLAREWLGPDFVAHYVAMRRAELAAQAEAVTDWETARYLEAL
jgi:glutamine synthetase